MKMCTNAGLKLKTDNGFVVVHGLSAELTLDN